MPDDTKSPAVSSSRGIQIRTIVYALSSFALGAWAFIKVNEISGPAFEPILGACTKYDAKDFTQNTNYHE